MQNALVLLIYWRISIMLSPDYGFLQPTKLSQQPTHASSTHPRVWKDNPLDFCTYTAN